MTHDTMKTHQALTELTNAADELLKWSTSEYQSNKQIDARVEKAIANARAVLQTNIATPAVLITVLGGVADYETTGDVEVGTIDFDNIEDGDGPVALSGALLQLARADNCLHEGEHYYDEATDPPHRYRNFYRHCGVEWDDTWSCTCNDKCPKCG